MNHDSGTKSRMENQTRPVRLSKPSQAEPHRLRLRTVSTLLITGVLAIMTVFGVSAVSHSSHAYAVSVDGEQVAVLVSEREATEAVELALTQEAAKWTDDTDFSLDYENSLNISTTDAGAPTYSSVTEAADLLKGELDFTASCVELLIDGQRVCCLASADEAIAAVNAAKSHFGVIDEDGVSAVYTEQQISFVSAESSLEQLLNADEAADLLLGLGDNADQDPLIDVVVERTTSEQVPLPYERKRVEDDTMVRGDEKIVSEGVDGLQEITYVATERNGEYVGREAVASTVLVPAVDEIVNVGTQLVADGVVVGHLAWPLKDGAGIVSSRYGWRSRGWHSGIDIAWDIYTTIVAVEDGVVTYADYNGGGYGNLVIVDHGDGVTTRYAHCDEMYVSVGDTVTRGQAIANIGMTGTTTGPHIHFEVRVNDNAVDPAPFIGAE